MKNRTFIYLIFLLITFFFEPKISAQFNSDQKFNQKLAKELNADDYGMKKYVIAFLKKGPNRSQDSITQMKLQIAHMKNIKKMTENGNLVLAGPFLDDGEIRGIYIFNVETIEEAKKLTKTDPLIQSGGLIMELHPWYGSAAMQKIDEIHKTIQKVKF